MDMQMMRGFLYLMRLALRHHINPGTIITGFDACHNMFLIKRIYYGHTPRTLELREMGNNAEQPKEHLVSRLRLQEFVKLSCLSAYCFLPPVGRPASRAKRPTHL